MTPATFRKIALGLEGAIESSHFSHPDFRVGGRIFATLGYPDKEWATVHLTPEQQRALVRAYPQMFEPAPGKWGEQGTTGVKLAAADDDRVGEALTLAWQNRIAKSAAKKKPAARGRRGSA